MDTKSDCPYGFSRHLEHTSVDAVLDKVKAALSREGFGILTTIDVKETLKKKLDVDFRGYLILGACNPVLAHKALTADPQIGLLLPCNVVIQEAEGGVTLSIADPHAMFTLSRNAALEPIVNDASERLGRVMAALA
jgi:uncharacterized protein (DUF302 family)